jgi:hypothetical protein
MRRTQPRELLLSSYAFLVVNISFYEHNADPMIRC